MWKFLMFWHCIWSLKLATWSLATWSLAPGNWHLEPNIWNVCTWHLAPGNCIPGTWNLKPAPAYLAHETWNLGTWHLCFLSLSTSPLRKSVSCNYYCKYNSFSLQTALIIFITLLFNVILNFQSIKMILGCNIFHIFILFINLCKIL